MLCIKSELITIMAVTTIRCLTATHFDYIISIIMIIFNIFSHSVHLTLYNLDSSNEMKLLTTLSSISTQVQAIL